MPKKKIDKNSHYYIDMFVSTIDWLGYWIDTRANLSLTDDKDAIYDQQNIEDYGKEVNSTH